MNFFWIIIVNILFHSKYIINILVIIIVLKKSVAYWLIHFNCNIFIRDKQQYLFSTKIIYKFILGRKIKAMILIRNI